MALRPSTNIILAKELVRRGNAGLLPVVDVVDGKYKFHTQAITGDREITVVFSFGAAQVEQKKQTPNNC